MSRGRHGQPWERWEEEALALHYGKKSWGEIATMIGRSEGAIGPHISKMKYQGRWPHPYNLAQIWTPTEDEILLDGVREGLSVKEICPHLPRRSEGAVSRRVTHLKRKGDLIRQDPPATSQASVSHGADEALSQQTARCGAGEGLAGLIVQLIKLNETLDRITPILERLEQSAATIKYAGVVVLALLEEGKRREKAVCDLLPNYGINEVRFFEEVDTLLANRPEAP